jgi:DNA-binding NarL/FixJ family response regulator
VFAGFGEWQDQVLNGLARLLEGQTERLTARQLAVANLLRDGLEQAQIAQELGVTRQAISEHARAIGWEALAQGEAALTLALARLPACP